MLKRYQAERMALSALPSSRNLLKTIIPQIIEKRCLLRYSMGAGQIYSLNVPFPCPLAAAVSLLSGGSVSCSLPWHYRAGHDSGAGTRSSEPAFCGRLPRSLPRSMPLPLPACVSPSQHASPPPSAPPSCSLDSALFAVVPLFSLSSSDGGLKSQQRSTADCRTSHSSSNANSAAGVGKAFPSAQGFPW